MKKTLLAGALIIPLLASGTYFAFRAPAPPPLAFRTGVFDPPRAAPVFTLDVSNGKKLNLRDHRGKVVIVEFGFTYCEHVCPITLARLTEVHKKLGAAAQDVQLIYVTVDPKRDNPERLREHLTAFNPSFLGATGTPAQLDAVYKDYGVVAKEVVSKNQALGYEVDHSSSLYLVDRQGKLRALVPFGTSADDIVHDLQLLLNAPA